MRDAHRMKERNQLSFDSRQLVGVTFGALVTVGLVFVLGVIIGRRLSQPLPPDRPSDLLTALDHKAQMLPADRDVPLTFQDELTKRPAPVPPKASAAVTVVDAHVDA